MSWVSMGATYQRRADTHTLYTPTDKYAFPDTDGGDESESEGSKPRLKMLQMLQIEEASTGMPLRMLTYADTCCRMLTYGDAWAELKSSLMYADVC